MTRHAPPDRPFWSAFRTQRHNAALRGIAWHLTFAEWREIWERSGAWTLRGKGQGRYAMSRRADAGAYEVGNVFIQSFIDNVSNGPQKKHPLPTGVVLCHTPGRFGAHKMVKGTRYWLGVFGTPEEAASAYQQFGA